MPVGDGLRRPSGAERAAKYAERFEKHRAVRRRDVIAGLNALDGCYVKSMDKLRDLSELVELV